MVIDVKELQHNNFGKNYENGYRIVYFYNDKYSIGEYCKTIEGFMIGFAECSPIIDVDDIPEFISIDDMLGRCLNDVESAIAVAIYKTDGTCIEKKQNYRER
ncbi:MAG: hypothetical protein E7166_05445 [Firmicutes bacterium]|nr:hypothetical protein [Bacillota bacterium]